MSDKASVYARAARRIAHLSGAPEDLRACRGADRLWLITGPLFGFWTPGSW